MKPPFPVRSLILALVACPLLAGAASLPQGGTVVGGSGAIGPIAGNTLTVSQSSQNLAINWQRFDIGAGYAVNFVQPNGSAIALNRVLGSDGSRILGSLNANGQVFLVNPNGVLFGKGAQVNVGGLVASTLDLAAADFMAGKRSFGGGSGSGVVNQGTLRAADGGYIALLGAQVSNEGVIAARLGTVALAAGKRVSLDFAGDKLLSVNVDQGALDALAGNQAGALIQADGGSVLLTAKATDALLQTVINQEGMVRAQTIERQGGVIKLLGGMDGGTVKVAGTLDASAPGMGDGGFVETSGAHVKIADGVKVTTLGANGGTSGTWLIDPQDYTIAASGGDISGATLSANLGLGNVEIQSASGGTAGNGDIHVNDAVSWSANKLTLTAARDININAVMTASGTSSLTMNTATANGSDAGVPGGVVNFGFHPGHNGTGGRSFAGRLDFPGRSGAGFLTINGQDYTVIQTPAQLAAIGGNLAGHYALGSDVDLLYSWTPLGVDQDTLFTGAFTGLGHMVWRPSVYGPANFHGLFGFNNGTLENVQIFMDQYSNIGGADFVGALAGYNDTGGIVRNVVAMMDGNPMIVGSRQYVGGLVGANSGTILNSHVVPYGNEVYNGAAIHGAGVVGGLVGYNEGAIYNSSASFLYVGVYGSSPTVGFGGLAGINNGAIANSYASGQVTPNKVEGVGGLVGRMEYGGASIANSYATGTVGSLVADPAWNDSVVGGLVGYMAPGTSVTNSYTTAAVVGSNTGGGLVGQRFNSGATVTNSFWDTANYATSDGGTGTTFANLTRASTFAGWDIGSTGGSSSVWRIYEGQSMPLLRSFLMPLTVTPAFDGSGTALGNIAAYTTSTPYAASAAPFIVGTAPTTLVLSSSAPGSYTATLGTNTFYSTQAGYDIAVVPRTVATPGSAAGDVVLANPVSWSSGTLAINTSGTATAGAAVSGTGSAVFDLQSGTWSQVGATLPAFSVIDFRLSGGTFVRAKGGDGSSGTPYQLADIYGVQGMGSSAGMLSKSYVLANDIDATGTTQWNAGAGFTPIGNGSGAPFLGRLDGANHVITGLTINRPMTDWVGLFGAVDSGSSIANLGLVDPIVHGHSYVGGLAGITVGVGIVNSYVANGTIYGLSTVGGLVGENNGHITSSYATGKIVGRSASSMYVGGLVGYMIGGRIIKSYAAAMLIGSTTWFGGLVGGNLSGGNTVSSYWDTQVSGLDTSAGGIGKTTAELMQAATFTGWDISASGGSSSVWRIYEGQSMPLLRSFLTPLTVTPAFDGSGAAMGNIAAYTTSTPGAAPLPGTAPTTLTLSSSSAGAYTATLGGSAFYSTQSGYDISYAPRTIATPGSAAGDIKLTAPITWNSGTLAINTGGAITDSAAINGTGSAVFDLQAGAWGQVGSTLPAFSVTDFRLSGGAFIRALGGDGSVGTPYRHADIYGVQGMGSSGMLGKSYTLANNIDASGTSSWNSGAGFNPVGNNGTPFTGIFDGDSHTIDSLNISRSTTDYVGLFGYISGASAEISNVGLTNANITGQSLVGGLVGYNDGTVSFSYASGTVTGTGDYVGGLVGYNVASVVNSHASDAVSGSRFVGGLVGRSLGAVFSSYASGTVIGSGDYVGGLVGQNAASVIDSHASGTVSGASSVGGLAGQNDDTIGFSYATGTVNGTGSYVGGLVGYNVASVVDSYASGTVSGPNRVGGLAGQNNGTVSSSYASGTVNSTVSYAGGLVGYNIASVLNSYASGTVNGNDFVGGLVGHNDSGTVSSSYASGTVTGGNFVGGLMGNSTGSVTNSFWDIANYATSAGGTGKATDKLTEAATFTGWDISASGGSSSVWRIYEGQSMPLLRSFLTPLTVTANSGSRVYDGTTGGLGVTYSATPNANLLGSLGIAGASRNAGSYTLTPDGLFSNQQGYDISYIGGALTITPASLTISTGNVSKTYDGTTGATGTAVAAGGTQLFGGDTLSGGTFAFTDKNVGAGKTVTVSGVTVNDGNGGGNYSIAYADNTASSIAKATLTMNAVTDSKTYDGTQTSGGTVTYSGLQTGDSLSGLMQGFASKNVLGTGNSVIDVISYMLADGNGGGNYNVVANAASGTITPASLTVSTSNVAKTYDGTTGATGTAVAAGGTQLFGGDTLSGGSFAFTDKNAGTNKTVTVSGVAVNDGNGGGNYTVSYADNTTSSIGKANLTISTSNVAKAYDGMTGATGTAVAAGGTQLFGGDTFSGGTFAFADKNVGAGKTVNVSGVTVNDGNGGGNYTVSYAANTVSTIAKATLTLNAAADSKTYDGTTTSGGTVTYSGLQTGDSLNGLVQSFAGKNAMGAGNSVIDVTGYVLADGNGGGNYSIVANSAAGTIGKATLALNATADSKTYDGTTTSGGTVTYSGLQTGDSLSGLVQGYASKNVLGTNGSTLNVTGYTLADGNGGGNYSVVANAASGTITPASLTVSTSNVAKTYDGTTSAAGTAVAARSTQLFGTDTLSGGSFAFADKNVGAGKTVTVSGVTVNDGNGGGNYTVAYADNTASSIAKATLTLNAATDSKTYDGTTASGGTVTYSGLQTGDSLSGLVQGYASKNVLGANGSTLNVTGYTLADGNGGGNYAIVANSAAGTITSASLAVGGATMAADKRYDGTRTAAVSGGTLSGALAGDDVRLVQSGLFDTKDAGTGKTVAYTDTLAGADAGNYTLAGGGTVFAAVTPASLTVSAGNAAKVYDGRPWTGGSANYSGLADGETPAVLGGRPVFGGNAQGAVAAGSYLISVSGLSSGNYAIRYLDGTLTIRPGGDAIAPARIAALGQPMAAPIRGAIHPVRSVPDDGFSMLGLDPAMPGIRLPDSSDMLR